MKRLALILAIIMCISLVGCGREPQGEPAPDFRMMDQNENIISLSELKGKNIILNFWASWCPPCKAELPDFEECYNVYKDDVTFLIVSLTSSYETVEKAQNYINECGYSFPVYFDIYGEASLGYELDTIPQTFFINKHGEIVHKVGQMISHDQLFSYAEDLVK